MALLVFAEAPAAGLIYQGAPMSLLYAIAPLLAAMENRRGPFRHGEHQVIVESCPSEHSLVELLRESRPRVLGLSATTYSAGPTDDALSGVSSLLEDCLVLFGGAHCDGVALDAERGELSFLEYFPRHADLVLTGRPENALARIVAEWLEWDGSKSQFITSLCERHGDVNAARCGYRIWARRCGSLARFTLADADRHIVTGIDVRRPALPPRHLLSDAHHRAFSIFTRGDRRLKTAQVLTYRGCLFAANPANACTFCFVGSSYAPSELKHTLYELRHLAASGYEAVFFDDGVFTSPSRKRKEELRTIVHCLEECGFGQVGFQTRADYIDEEVLDILSAAADVNWYCAIGVESTEQGILDSVQKKQSKANVEHAFSLLRRHRFRVGVYLLFGAPGPDLQTMQTLETVATAQRTIGFVADAIHAGTNIVSVLPGIEMLLPGTKDAARYRRSQASARRPLTFGIVHEGNPWDRFEGGRGFHVPGVTEELASQIASYGQRQLQGVWAS